MRSVVRRLALALLSLPLAVTACSTSEGDEPEASEDALTSGAVTASVEQALMVRNPSERNKTWTITKGNALTGDWLMQVPRGNTWGKASVPSPKACSGSSCLPDFGLATCSSDSECGGGSCVELNATKKSDGAAAARVCAGHSDSILDEIYGVMTSAHSTLDITTLSAPTGRFLATLRNGITTLDKRNEPVSVRVLFGSFPNNAPDLPKILGDLTRDVSQSTKLTISIGAHRRTPTSWNHSKIIAADGREAIIGGMNLWGDHYLDVNPVHDVSLHVRGPIATASQVFVNDIWSVPCGDGKIVGNRGNGCPRAFAGEASAGQGNIRMIGVGRTGEGGQGRNRNPSDTALVAMMDAARSSIRISQQDIGSVKVFLGGVLPEPYMDAWIRAAIRGVDVNVVVSNLNSFGGTGTTTADSYANGWKLSDLWSGLIRRMQELFPGHEADLCARVHFSNVRASANATWPNGKPLANHSKVVIIDDQAHYVGSQNLYDADLAEFGVIVDDQTATKQFIADYYSKLNEFSKVTTFKDNFFCR
jgi:phosphatidylserine/phosphatidylglycerophosphate/cardiolipin synthase-like enzyme